MSSQAYVNSSKDNDEENEALRAEVESLREEKIASHDLVARLKNENSASSLASLKSSSSSLNDLNLESRGRDESILKNLETKVQDLTDENHKLGSELRLMVDDKLETREEMEALKAAAATAESSKDVALSMYGTVYILPYHARDRERPVDREFPSFPCMGQCVSFP